MKLKVYLIAAITSAALFSCVSPKKLEEEKAKYTQLSGDYLALQEKYRNLQDDVKK